MVDGRLIVRGVLRGLLLIVSLQATVMAAETDLTTLEGQPLHEQLVRTAMAFDVFNQRCRGVSASTQESQVNRLFVEKYRMTLNNFVREMMPMDARQLESEIQARINQRIFELGGCQKARADGMEARFKADFRTLMEKARQSPWYPIPSR
ncbi:hypothetical protein [Thiomicrospira sp. WB1]|uniref:hypothetical protein n=1 Tax=Thiomicrospira sp. WB1 TaxID=1685380 RepID=UPI000749D320|nr:hypothetical protein [Thiomicrospira sp. WB1]KUJ72894.1 hypothetical protein AVO41_03695 [Thiomicrospira sp. WB1]